MYLRVFIEGTAAIGKTTFLENLKENLDPDKYEVKFIDFHHMCTINKCYKHKSRSPIYNELYNIDILQKILDCDEKVTTFIDRSPLSNIFYTQIFKIVKLSKYDTLEADCQNILNIITEHDYFAVMFWNVLKSCKLVIYNTSNIEETAQRLFDRHTETDEALAEDCGFKFDLEYCKWYTTVQYHYFKLFAKQYKYLVVYKECDYLENLKNSFSEILDILKKDYEEDLFIKNIENFEKKSKGKYKNIANSNNSL